jgi:hypothetical protein
MLRRGDAVTNSESWSTPTGQPVQAPVDLQPSQPDTHKKRRRSIVVGASVIGLAGLGVVGYLALKGGGTAQGASSPEAAVQGLVAALDSDDALAALGVVAPDEVEGVSTVLEAVQASAAENGLGKLTTGGDTDLKLEVGKSKVSNLSDNAARVEVKFSGSFTASGTLGALVGTKTNSFDDGEVRLVAIKIGGGWFVSPMLSLGDYLVDQLDLPDGDYDEVGAKRGKTSSGKSATDAVESLLNGVADFDRDAVSDSLASGEARFVDVFERAIDELIDRGQQELSENGLSIELSDLGLQEQDKGAVGVSDAEINYTNINGSGKVEIDDDCFTTTNEFGDRHEGCMLANAPFTTPLTDSHLVLQTAKEGGAYRVQLLKSAATLAVEIADRLDKQTLLQAFDAEFLDTATPSVFGESTSGEFDGEQQYQVFEIDVPANEAFTLGARADDDDDYVNYNTYVLDEDGRWENTYFGSGTEPLDKATKARIVVYAGCDSSDDDAVLFDCEDYSKTAFTVAAQKAVTGDATFLESSTFTLEPGQQETLTFNVDTETDATYEFVDSNGESQFGGVVNGPYGFNDDGSLNFIPGEYTAIFVNPTSSKADFTLNFHEVEVVEQLRPTDISLGSPTTTFDLSVSSGVEFGAFGDTGDSLFITATPENGQDIVLYVGAGTTEICGPTTNGDFNGAGGSETCSFDVTSGGRFPVYVYGISGSDNTGLVTVTISVS